VAKTLNPEAVQEILEHLRQRIEGLDHIVLIRHDGSLIAQLQPLSEQALPEISPIITELVGLAEEVCLALERGANTEAILKGQERFLAFYRSKVVDLMLGVVGQAAMNFGLLNSGCRIALQKLEELHAAA
jgi:predicted regulator of Ras-like GTPase activity (Roadblock/LC7/MglB family)